MRKNPETEIRENTPFMYADEKNAKDGNVTEKYTLMTSATGS